MHYLPFRSLSVVALVLAGACTEIDDDDLEFRTTIGDGPFGCQGCPPNGPVINDFQFPELHLDGLPNSDGVILVGLLQPSTNDLFVMSTDNREELLALDKWGQPVAGGAELIGWKLLLRRGEDYVEGHIVAHDDSVPRWNDLERATSTYAISFPSSGGSFSLNVCPTYMNTPNAPVLTIIRGATYDRDEKRVDLLDDDWVTFACADEAAYKAKLLGYEPAMPLGLTGVPATRDQQDATLKMITADYCGTGYSFTEHGIHMAWEDAADTVNMLSSDLGPLEAKWDHNGAVCLDFPRMALLVEVAGECTLPPECDEVDLTLRPPVWTTWQPPLP